MMAAGEVNLLDELKKGVPTLEGQALPNSLAALFDEQKINFRIKTTAGDEIVFGVVTEDKIVTKAVNVALEKPTLEFFTDEQTLLALQKSPDPMQTLKESLDNGKISYKAVGFFNKIKFAFSSVFLKVAAAFGKEISDEVAVEESEAKELSAEEVKVLESKVEGKKTEEENKAKEAAAVEEKKSEETEAAVSGSNIVNLINSGFSVKEIKIKKGDTVEWKNVRTGQYTQAMIIGTQKCAKVKSGFINPQGSFKWTFDETGTCLIVDGILTTQSMKVVVE
jgi:plastocyanin